MKTFFKSVFLVGLISVLVIGCKGKKDMKPPVAEKIKKDLTIHGDTRVDNYYWLNDRDDEKVLTYLKDENAYTDAMMEHTEKLQKNLFDEIVGRIKQDDESVPYKLNGFFYYTRYEEGKEYPLYCRKNGSLEAAEEIMLNVNEMAKDFAYYAVGGSTVSPNNKLVAFGVDTLSRRKYDIYFKDLTTGKVYDEVIENTTGSAVWANDNKTIFYVRKDHTLRPYKIFKHVLGTDPAKDVEVYHESDETFNIGVGKTKSEKYIIIASESTVSSEYHVLDADKPNSEFKVFQKRERGLEYSISHYGNSFYIVTNMDARNFRLMKTPVNKTSKKNWKEVIKHRENVLLENIEIFKKYLVVQERKDGLRQIRIINWKSEKEYYMEFRDPAYSAFVSYNPDFNTDLLRYGYSSLVVPYTLYDYDMNTKEQTLLKQTEVVGGYDKENYVSERIYVKARDGVSVPVSIVYKKGTKKDGKNPLLLYAYGSYGYSMEAYFSSARLSLLDRGFVYAIAHIRGGQEMGRHWYEDGKLLKKKNTFTDFIDCGKELVKLNYTSPEKLCAMGGSAGGLLMGAVINMQPDLFKAVIAAVPFVDVVTTMLDDSIPLTTGEYDEWGNPNVKEYYDYMLSYSPYDQVKKQNYPSMLVTTGLHDSQVQYWEPAKWIAKLRDYKTDNNLLMLRTNMETGHGGASGRFKRYEETAMEYAFFLDQVGLAK
ncbi:MAG: S9 family peptidase [Rhodothermaceae bacterium]